MIQRKQEISPILLHCIFGSHRGSPWKDGLERLCSFQTLWMDTELLQKRCVPCTNACKTKVLFSQCPPRYIISAWNSHGINLSFSLLKFPVRLCSDDDNDDDDSKWFVYSTVRGFYVYQLQVKPTVIFFFGNTSSLFNMPRFIHLNQELCSPSVTHTGVAFVALSSSGVTSVSLYGKVGALMSLLVAS